MGEPSAEDILIVDDTVCDELVRDVGVDRALERAQTEAGPGSQQLVCAIDRYSGLIVAFTVSYDEMGTVQ